MRQLPCIQYIGEPSIINHKGPQKSQAGGSKSQRENDVIIETGGKKASRIWGQMLEETRNRIFPWSL